MGSGLIITKEELCLPIFISHEPVRRAEEGPEYITFNTKKRKGIFFFYTLKGLCLIDFDGGHAQ